MLSVLLDVTVQSEGSYLVGGEGGKESCLPFLLQVNASRAYARSLDTEKGWIVGKASLGVSVSVWQ